MFTENCSLITQAQCHPNWILLVICLEYNDCHNLFCIKTFQPKHLTIHNIKLVQLSLCQIAFTLWMLSKLNFISFIKSNYMTMTNNNRWWNLQKSSNNVRESFSFIVWKWCWWLEVSVILESWSAMMSLLASQKLIKTKQALMMNGRSSRLMSTALRNAPNHALNVQRSTRLPLCICTMTTQSTVPEE